MIRALAINAMFVNHFYRRMADELGAYADLDLSIFMPHGWKMNQWPLPLDPPRVGAPYRMMTGKTHWSGYENRGHYLTGLAKAFRVSKPDVIYMMEEPFSFFAVQILLARNLFAPHTPVVFFTWNNLSLKEFDYRPSVLYRTIASWTLPQMDRALTANSDAIGVLREAGFRNPARSVGYGVDTEKFASVPQEVVQQLRERMQIPTNDPVIGYIGRIRHMKGLDLLVDAFAEVLRVRDATLVIVGGGEYDDELSVRISRLGIRDRVRRVPVVAQEEVPAYMHLFDTMVLPSRRQGMWAEQFGRVLVEAMAAGTLVVGSTSGAIPEVIGNAGFTFRENDAHDLQQTLLRALQLPQTERNQLLQIGRERASTVYSWSTFARNSHEALVAAVDSRRRRQ